MAQNIRQQVAESIVKVLKEMTDPRPVFVSREPVVIQEMAITQFPAVFVQPTVEDRETITMGAPGAGRRMGRIEYSIRAYVRGTELDRQRNDLIEAIEEALDSDRYRDLIASGVTDSQITRVEIIDRQPPLAEFVITYVVTYNYLRGAV
jgi:hypothetical protein